MRKQTCWIFVSLILIQLPFLVMAEQDEDVAIGGFEVEKLLNLGSGIVAIILFVTTLLAYLRTRNKRLQYVSAAFLLFAVKGILVSLEAWYGDWAWVDIIASTFDFAILLCFFLGILRK